MEKLKVFFGCSMRGGYGEVSKEFLQQIPAALEEIGLELMSKHQTQPGILQEENRLSTISIHDRDYGWLKGCNIAIFEISNPSLGVGGEISDGVILGKGVLALHQPRAKVPEYVKRKLERYCMGQLVQYERTDELEMAVRDFIASLNISNLMRQMQDPELIKKGEISVVQYDGKDIAKFDISNPDTDVGAQIADAVHIGIPVLALYEVPEETVSAYIRGKLESYYPRGRHARYKGLNEKERIIQDFAAAI